MNLKLEKIKRTKLIDYSTLSDYIKTKNGKIVFIQGLRNISKIYSKKKLDHNIEFERKFQFNLILKNFKEVFNKKSPNKNITVDNKSKTSRIFFPKFSKNNSNISKDKTKINYSNYQKDKKSPITIRKYIKYNNSEKTKPINSNKIKKRKKIFNNNIKKELFDEYQKIKNIVYNNNNSINDKELKTTDRLIKNQSETQCSIKDYKYDKKIFILKNKPNKSMIQLDKSNNFKSLYQKFSSYSYKNNNKIYISQLKNNNIESLNKYSFATIKKKKNSNKVKKMEDDCKMELNNINDYDVNSKTILDLKDNYNFIESNDFESTSLTNRNKYILKIRKVLKKSPGINLKKDFRLSAKRIRLLKIHKYI